MNTPYILRRWCTGKTAWALVDYFKEKGIKVKTSKAYLGYTPLIRWGNSDNPVANDTKFNDPILIAITAHKLRMSKILQENKIPCVTFQRGTPEKFPVVVRQKLVGQGGVGIIIIEDYEHWKPYKDFYWSQFIPFRYEIRIHTLGGNPVKILRKKLLNGEQEEKYPIRNNDRKYHYKRSDMSQPKYGNALQLVKDIYKIFPMMMVGWDIGYYNKLFYIIEGNSAPSLNSINVEVYGDYLLENLNLESDNGKCLSGRNESKRS